MFSSEICRQRNSREWSKSTSECGVTAPYRNSWSKLQGMWAPVSRTSHDNQPVRHAVKVASIFTEACPSKRFVRHSKKANVLVNFTKVQLDGRTHMACRYPSIPHLQTDLNAEYESAQQTDDRTHALNIQNMFFSANKSEAPDDFGFRSPVIQEKKKHILPCMACWCLLR